MPEMMLFSPPLVFSTLPSFQLSAERFEWIWLLKNDWYEAPNYRRGGWSGVIRSSFDVNGQHCPVYIKKQENHLYRNWRHPLHGEPTLVREYNNIKRLQALQIGTLNIVAYGKRGNQAILVTHALDDYTAFSDLDITQLSYQERWALLTRIAQEFACLHSHHLQHGCLYPKHIFVKRDEDNSWHVTLIDLEKMKRVWRTASATRQDISCFFRHAPTWMNAEIQDQFLAAYYDFLDLA